MELVGFWGPPGTPPQGKTIPEGVSPIAFNTQATPAEYQQVYPQGSSTKYYIHATTSPNEVNVEPKPEPKPEPEPSKDINESPLTTLPPNNVDVTPSNTEQPIIIPVSTETPVVNPVDDGNNQNQSNEQNQSSSSTTTTGVIGFILGFLCKVLYDYIWSQYVAKRGYNRIPDSDIQI